MLALYFVILNEVKNLEVSVAVDGSASLEILRCTQDDIERDCHEPNGSRNDEDAVILNAVKNLEVSVAVDRSASLEILRFTQDDIESERDCHGLFQASQ